MPSNSLEQEAMDRVRRMYSSFERRPQSRSPQRVPEQPAEPVKPPEHHEPKPEHMPEPLPKQVHAEKPRGMLELLMQDKDQSLIMLLLVILLKDGADMNLLVALIYMLL